MIDLLDKNELKNNIDMSKISVGFAITGSFCTHINVIPVLESLSNRCQKVIPILSDAASQTDTRFGKAVDLINKIESITGNKIVHSIVSAEPLGPKKLVDALIIAPCTSNTLAKIAIGITDSTVSMAAKSVIRNENPVILAIATNDGLGNSAKNIGFLLNVKNIYFVPFGQDDAKNKPRSIVAHMDLIEQTLNCALKKQQIQPLLS